MELRVETKLKLDSFKARPYQYDLIKAWESGCKKMLSIMPRRAGKDVVSWNIAIQQCIEKVCTVYYMLPKLSQARKVIWLSHTNDGRSFMDFIPPELIAKKHEQDMRIHFTNGSILQLAGSDSFNRLVGSNAYGIVFSEFALTHPEAYHLLRPIVVANDGWMIMISTPRGRNFMWEVYNVAKESDDWFVQKLTVEDTKHISLYDIQKEEAEGLISRDKIRQEYYTDFNLGIEGTIFGRYLDKARFDGRVGTVPYEGYQVNTAWDIGRATTAIVFFEVVGHIVRFIDYYEKANENLEHFVKILEQKDYRYGKACFPHDMAVTEWSGAKLQRLEKAKMYGLKAIIVPKMQLEDGIEHVRSNFIKCWFDETKCERLLACLENYQREYNEIKKIYSAKPLHNWASHGADAFRYALCALPKLSVTTDAQALEKRYRKARYGTDQELPPFFR